MQHARVPITIAVDRSRRGRDQIAEHVDLEWFSNDRMNRQRIEASKHDRIGGRRHDDGRLRSLAAAHVIDHPEAVDARHHEIDHDDVVRRPADHLDRLGAVARGIDLEPRTFDDLRDQSANRRFVIDNEDFCRSHVGRALQNVRPPARPGLRAAGGRCVIEGLTYRADFLSAEEEGELLQRLDTLPFGDVVMMGVVARRKVIHYGYDYDYDGWSIRPADPVPDFLAPLVARCAQAAGVDAGTLEQMLVARYPPGATIGWPRDAPMFGAPVIGVSLGSESTMRFRRKTTAGGWERESLQLAPRSLYILDGAARSQWQHSIPPTPALRYSLTLRTLRKRKGR